MSNLTLILTAYEKDYYNYLSMILKVNPRNNKDYKLCTDPELIRGITPKDIKECVHLVGSEIKSRGDSDRIYELLYQAERRGFEIKRITY